MLPYNEDIGSITEIEEFLADAPTGLLLENIRSQITDNFCSVNYINVYSDKLNVIEDSIEDDSDLKRLVNDYRNSFFSKVLDIIDEKFSVRGIIDYNDPRETEEIATDLYEFLIVDIRKNLVRFFYNFIVENKKRIIEDLQIAKPKKDVVTNQAKKTLKGNDIKIISNIYEVVNYISDMNLDNEEFIELSRSDVLFDYNNNSQISGNIYAGIIGLAREQGIVQDVVPDVMLKLTE